MVFLGVHKFSEVLFGHGIGIHAAGAWKTANGSSTVNAGGLPVNRTGDNDDCLHARVGGSNNVNVG